MAKENLNKGKVGRGWSEHEKDSKNSPKKYFLRHPILVIDSIGITKR